ncbi:MAG: glutamyl-tRNA amidotransferase [Proteobacteria bacterium]|nr:glutamyl-tRNA amidotransferase [Pseudomonadota bacterium]
MSTRWPTAGWVLAVAACATVSSGWAAPARNPAAEAVVEGTIGDIQARIASRELRCSDVVGAYLERIKAYDKPRALNAITTISSQALLEAQKEDRSLGHGRSMPPLFCVPVVVKDNMDTAGMPTTAGSIALKENRPPDSVVVQRLRSAGAIIIAKSNMAEWAFSPRRTISSTAGETANAYALERVPAGSSGGTASSVAASLALVGLGTDTGNSIRGPSSHLALVGMRSTLGLVDLQGIVPLLADYDVAGPMTRTVEDNARVLSVIARTPEGKQIDYTKGLRTATLRGVRIGILRALADPKEMTRDIGLTFEQALSDLRAAGAIIVEDVTIPDLNREGGLYCPGFRTDVNNYLASLGDSAPIHDVAEVFRQGRYAPESKEQFEFFMRGSEQPQAAACPDFASSPARVAFRHDVIAAMEAAKVAVLAYPSWSSPPALRSRAVEDYSGDNSQRVAPPTGLPALTVPMGYSKGNLPVGLQLLGRAYDEATIYQIAYAYEQATHHRVPPTGFPAL